MRRALQAFLSLATSEPDTKGSSNHKPDCVPSRLCAGSDLRLIPFNFQIISPPKRRTRNSHSHANVPGDERACSSSMLISLHDDNEDDADDAADDGTDFTDILHDGGHGCVR